MNHAEVNLPLKKSLKQDAFCDPRPELPLHFRAWSFAPTFHYLSLLVKIPKPVLIFVSLQLSPEIKMTVTLPDPAFYLRI
jgi:hypothetical protein